jgi:hypothetical protein
LVNGISGGQPSTTQPIAIPWLSPKVVTRNMWPKVLWDIVVITLGYVNKSAFMLLANIMRCVS